MNVRCRDNEDILLFASLLEAGVESEVCAMGFSITLQGQHEPIGHRQFLSMEKTAHPCI